MTTPSPIALGPYKFTPTDARRTLAVLGQLWESLTSGRHSPSVDRLGVELGHRLHRIVGREAPDDLASVGVLASSVLSNSPLLEVALADVWTTLHEAGEKLRHEGLLPRPADGTVVQVSASNGGVPKLALPSVEVDYAGVVGDKQRFRNHHGRPWQALCIYSDEVISMLQAEGHPIGRGSAGENVTISGIPWADVRAGVELRIGTVLALVQAPATPCASNAPWFIDGEFMRMHESRGAVSRMYATVLEPGHIAPGDEVVLEPRTVRDQGRDQVRDQARTRDQNLRTA